MEDLGVDDIAHWLVHTVKLPEYEQVFRKNEVDGDTLLRIVSSNVLVHLVGTRASPPASYL